MWMRDRRDGPGIHADASGTEGPDAGSLRVSNGRRCEHHNDRVSTAKNKKNGVHTLGQASDILISGERAMLLFEKPVRLVSAGSDCLKEAHIRIGSSTLIRNLERLCGVISFYILLNQ